MKIKSFKNLSKSDFEQFRQDIGNELESLGKKYGVVFKAGNISYMAGNASIKLEANCISSDGEVITKEAEDFKMMASLYGLKKEDLGRKFKSNGQVYVIAGWLRRSRTLPVLCKIENGGQIKCSVESVKQRLILAEVK